MTQEEAGAPGPQEDGAGACPGPVFVSRLQGLGSDSPLGRVWWAGAPGRSPPLDCALKAGRRSPAWRMCEAVVRLAPGCLLPLMVMRGGSLYIHLDAEFPRAGGSWTSGEAAGFRLPASLYLLCVTQLLQASTFLSGQWALKSLAHHLP